MAGLQHDDALPAALAEVQYNEKEKSHRPHPHDVQVSSASAEVLENDPHYGDEFPTEEELQTLHRYPDRIPWSAYLIAYVELAERFSYYGCTVVFTNFIQQPLPPGSSTGAGHAGQSGALGKGQQASTGLTTFNSFWVYVMPLFGAYVADRYWGRFKTICVAVAIAIIGHVLLVVSAIPSVLKSSNGALACFCIAIVVMGVGTGAFKSNISPLVAEQYRKTKPFIQTRANGERVIIDPSLTASRTYMYFYLFINIGALVGQVGMVYAEKNVGFWLAYLLPTLVLCTTPLVLLIGNRWYIKSPPAGSVLASSMRVFRQAAKGKWTLNPIALARRFSAADFYDSAKPSHVIATTGERPYWMTFDDQWVDEVRRGFKACSVFLWFPIYWLTYNQINNNLTSQAATMETHGLPNDILSNLDPFALIILIPLCDLFIYPALRRAGIKFTPIKKITLGFFTGSAAMVWAAVVQYYIYKTNPCGNQASTCLDADKNALVSPLNVWIQTGSYILIALSEIFASITGLEYAFTKAPKNMRSLVMAMFLFMSAISSAIGEAFVTLSADPLLVWNYGSMAVLSFLAGVGFWFSYRSLDKEEDHLNLLDTGHLNTDAAYAEAHADK